MFSGVMAVVYGGLVLAGGAGGPGFHIDPATQTVVGSTSTLTAPFILTNDSLSARSFQFFLQNNDRPSAPSPGSSPVLAPGESFAAVVQWSGGPVALTDTLLISAFSPVESGGDGVTSVSAQITFQYSPPPPPCTGDTNGDRVVNSADLSVLLAQFGSSVVPGTGADVNNDGFVNGADLSVLLANFGNVC